MLLFLFISYYQYSVVPSGLISTHTFQNYENLREILSEIMRVMILYFPYLFIYTFQLIAQVERMSESS